MNRRIMKFGNGSRGPSLHTALGNGWLSEVGFPLVYMYTYLPGLVLTSSANLIGMIVNQWGCRGLQSPPK